MKPQLLTESVGVPVCPADAHLWQIDEETIDWEKREAVVKCRRCPISKIRVMAVPAPTAYSEAVNEALLERAAKALDKAAWTHPAGIVRETFEAAATIVRMQKKALDD